MSLKRSTMLKFVLMGLTISGTSLMQANTTNASMQRDATYNAAAQAADIDISCTLRDVHGIVESVKEKARVFFLPERRYRQLRITKTFMEYIQEFNPILDKAEELLAKYQNQSTTKEQLLYDIILEATDKLTKVYNILSGGYSNAVSLGLALKGVISPAEVKRLENRILELRPYLSEIEVVDLENLVAAIRSFEKEKIIPKSMIKQLKILRLRMSGR